jgi:hypothetical protein
MFGDIAEGWELLCALFRPTCSPTFERAIAGVGWTKLRSRSSDIDIAISCPTALTGGP